MKEKIHCLWFEMIVTFWALSDFQIFHKCNKSLVMRIASLRECFSVLGKIKKKKEKMALELMYLETGQWKRSSERPSAYSLAYPPLVLFSCVTR